VSLILEALRKLEREKQVPVRGFLVLPPAADVRRGTRLLGPLALLVLLAVGALVWRREAPRPAAAPPPTAPPATLPVRAAEAPKPLPPSPEPPVPTFTLQAISDRDGTPIAVLNEHTVVVGDTLEGARIVSIGTDSVEIEFRGKKRVVRF
jgi:hypothetical protein